MKLCMIGAGHVGLVSGACFAEMGNEVICVDVDKEKIAKLDKGVMPFFEPGLEELTKKNTLSGKLTFTTDFEKGVKESEIIFIAVGTPSRDNGEADLSYVEGVARKIAETMKEYKVVVEKSTVPVKTGEWVKRTIRLNNVHAVDFDVVSNPEFLREGAAIYDFMHPDRVVIGVESEKAEKIMKDLYQPLETSLIVTDIESAEITKHASNSFLALKISYINAIANICERVGADVEKVAAGMGLDNRIGQSFLNAGVGYGGSCFPKDVSAFIKIAEEAGYDFQLLKVTEQINHDQRKLFFKKIKEALWILNNKTIGILGLAFKPDTDDVRESPSLKIIKQLLSEGVKIKAFDPAAMDTARMVLKNSIEYCCDSYETAAGSDCLLVLTEWDQFKNLDFKHLKSLLKNPLILDGRNIYNRQELENMGFTYVRIGR